jgi:hypothetical protein
VTGVFSELPPRTPSPTEVKRILRAVATIILAAFVEEEAGKVKPSKKASQKKRGRKAKASRKTKKKYVIKAKRSTRSSKKKARRKTK